MSDFVILTDSSADLDAQLAAQLGVVVLPLRFTFGADTFCDQEMEPKALYDRLRQGDTATTSALNVADYTQALEPILQSGKDVLILAFSSGLSTTYNSACMAAEELSEKYPQRKLYAVDTLCASLGQGMLVYLAVQEQRKGRTIEEVRDWAEETKLHICHQVTVNDLHFLKRGGRISATTAVVGSMLQIKPLIHMDDKGCLMNDGKCRGRHTALKTLVDRMEQTATAQQPVFISHGDCLEDAQTVAQMVKDRLGVPEVYINYVGPVIGAHTGPGVVALFYVGRSR